ncbi:right-handed parallel beta-helix repeat-containing protein [Streptomyces sp. Ru87]|uniref:right-handed parallel beta-helix repeat-containing protein n=1 Tax=Streptomyces sp. Ru87 TaxID=2044307 RepID=UPI000BF65EE3|nr:right-handed parallel beta-helix repeat-containing protein [Streptomyces sp. Ru87]PGH46981.1 hypothetical protein CRI70_30960 [Streptomyces sp. Ru87]
MDEQERERARARARERERGQEPEPRPERGSENRSENGSEGWSDGGFGDGSGARPPAVQRRSALAGIVGAGLAGAGAAGAAGGLLASGGAQAAQDPGRGLPVLPPGADWGRVLARTPQVQLAPGTTYTLDEPVELPDDCWIAGNGATVTVSGDSLGALRITGRRNVTVTGVRFLGRAADPVDSPMVAAHVGVALTRSFNVRVLDCDFERWRGAGVTVTGSVDDDYYAYRVKLRGNSFDRCYFGVSAADRSEYSVLGGNSFTYCRLAIWNSSGNWTVNDNNVMGCRGAYYSLAETSPYGSLPADNWNHGSLAGNTFNHSNSGGRSPWTRETAFPVGGEPRDPGPGVVVGGVLPPTFSGNTLWYTDLTATDLQGTRWLLSGSTFSHLTIACTGTAPVHLVGTQSRNPGAAPVLRGNVKDLLEYPG